MLGTAGAQGRAVSAAREPPADQLVYGLGRDAEPKTVAMTHGACFVAMASGMGVLPLGIEACLWGGNNRGRRAKRGLFNGLVGTLWH